jgi:hypothetical protein
MDETRNRPLRLRLDARPPLLPVAAQFVETAAAVFGLGKEESLKLALATEEIFVYLCKAVCPGNALEIDCLDGLSYTRVIFRFSASALNLRGLNIASAAADDRECDLEEMGLMIASRSVDRLHLTVEAGNRVSLDVTKEKAYPRVAGTIPLPGPPATLSMETPDSEGVKRFALLAGQVYAEKDRPSFFDYPGKVADMVAGGEFRCLVAMNAKKEIVGGILFGERSERIIHSFGPYLFHGGDGRRTGEALLEACLGRIARSKALGLLSVSGLPPALEVQFEPLGSLSYHTCGKASVPRPFFFRHLHEDPGCEAWSPGEFTAWLESQYGRLVLAREIRTVRAMGETRTGASLLAAELARERAEAVLRPLLPGSDLAANVERHIRFLTGDGFLNLFFELDLGVPWQSELVPVLMGHGFRPELLLPFAGQADLVIFQHADATEP